MQAAESRVVRRTPSCRRVSATRLDFSIDRLSRNRRSVPRGLTRSRYRPRARAPVQARVAVGAKAQDVPGVPVPVVVVALPKELEAPREESRQCARSLRRNGASRARATSGSAPECRERRPRIRHARGDEPAVGERCVSRPAPSRRSTNGYPVPVAGEIPGPWRRPRCRHRAPPRVVRPSLDLPFGGDRRARSRPCEAPARTAGRMPLRARAVRRPPRDARSRRGPVPLHHFEHLRRRGRM